ncbi:hypothetical protein M758_1G173700 [Ceratodon purpureus]|nr:hypothetical protein M758_1G173700 [Ceratodon purpureus]
MTLRNRLQGSLNGQIDGDNLAKGGIFGNLNVEHGIFFGRAIGRIALCNVKFSSFLGNWLAVSTPENFGNFATNR